MWSYLKLTTTHWTVFICSQRTDVVNAQGHTATDRQGWDSNPHDLNPQSAYCVRGCETGVRILVGVRGSIHHLTYNRYLKQKRKMLVLKQGIMSKKKCLRQSRLVEGSGMGWITAYSGCRSGKTSLIVIYGQRVSIRCSLNPPRGNSHASGRTQSKSVRSSGPQAWVCITLTQRICSSTDH